MASQYSLLREYSPYVSPYNMDLIAQGMQYKQEKFDANRASLNAYVTQILDMEIDKPQDREYLENRVNELVQSVNKNFRGQDLSSQGVANAIINQIGSAIDTKVMNAVASTREYRRFAEQMEDIRLNKPELWSSVNEQDAMEGYVKWLNDGQVGTKAPTPHYTPYTDYRKEAREMLEVMMKNRKTQKVKIPDGNGYYIEKNYDQCTPEEIRLVLENGMSQNAIAQMHIDAKYMAKTNPSVFNQRSTADFINNQAKKYDDRITLMRYEMNKAGADEARRQQLMESIERTKKAKEDFIERGKAIIGENYDPIAAAAFTVRENFLESMGTLYSYNNNTVEYSSDPTFTANKRLEFDIAQAAVKNNLEERKFGLEQQEFEFDKEYKRGQLENGRITALSKYNKNSKDGNNITGAFGTNGSAYDSIATTVTSETSPNSEIPANRINTDLAEATVNATNWMNNMMRNVDDPDGNGIAGILSAARAQGQYKDVPDDEAYVDIVEKSGGIANIPGMTADAIAAYRKMAEEVHRKQRAQKYIGRMNDFIKDALSVEEGAAYDNAESYIQNAGWHRTDSFISGDRGEDIFKEYLREEDAIKDDKTKEYVDFYLKNGDLPDEAGSYLSELLEKNGEDYARLWKNGLFQEVLKRQSFNIHKRSAVDIKKEYDYLVKNGDADGVARLLKDVHKQLIVNAIAKKTIHTESNARESYGLVNQTYGSFRSNIFDPDNIALLQEVANLNGDDILISDLFVKDENGYYKLNDAYEDTLTYQMLDHFKNDASKSFLTSNTRTYVDDILNGNETRMFRNELLKDYISTTPRYQTKVFKKGQTGSAERDMFDKLANTWNELADTKGFKSSDVASVTSTPGFSISVEDNSDGGLSYILYPNGKDYLKVELPKSWFADNALPDFQKDTSTYRFEDLKTFTLDGVSFATEGAKSVLEDVLTSPDEIAVADKVGTLQSINNEFGSTVYTTTNERGELVDTGIKPIVENIINNSSKFVMEAKPVVVNGRRDIVVSIWDKNGYKNDRSNPITRVKYKDVGMFVDDFVERLQVCPQYFFVDAVREALKIQQNDILSNKDIALVPQLDKLNNAASSDQSAE